MSLYRHPRSARALALLRAAGEPVHGDAAPACSADAPAHLDHPNLRQFYYECGAPRGANVTAGQATLWLRQYIARTADDAACRWFTEQDDSLYEDLCVLGTQVCDTMEWQPEIGTTAVYAEGQAARARFMKLNAAMLDAVESAAYRRDPGPLIIAAAERVIERTNFYISRESVIDFCRRVAHASRRRG